MDTIYYSQPRIQQALKALFPEAIIRTAYRPGSGFFVDIPRGVDWADYEPQPDLLIEQPGLDRYNKPLPPIAEPQPDLRVPRDPWLYYNLGVEQPDAPTVNAWQPAPVEIPDPEPLTDVEIATANFRQARLAAPAALDSLKGMVWAALVAGGLAPDEATAAGVGLVLLHGPLLAAFEAAGGHPVAGDALCAAIASPESVAALPWLKPEVLAIFAAALTPEVGK